MGGERDGCSASRMWRSGCGALAAPGAEDAWQQLVDASPSDAVWHSLRNCVAYQAGIWHNLLSKGAIEVKYPAAFKLAVVLRHTPSELTARLLADLLQLHPQARELTAYILALLTDDEACSGSSSDSDDEEEEEEGEEEGAAAGPAPAAAPLRDLQLYGDCELAVLAARREEYEAHAKLVRAEYAALTNKNYVELRLKVLNQLARIPKLYHTPEFESFEPVARENIEREVATLREHLLAGGRRQ